MNQTEPEKDWLISVAFSHSQSIATEEQHKRVWTEYASFIGTSGQQISTDYESSDDRTLKRKHASYPVRWIGHLMYKEKAMPFLRLETNTPMESEKQIQELRQQLQDKTERLKTLETKIGRLEPLMDLIEKENPDNLRDFVRAWLETDDTYKAFEASDKGQPYKRKIHLELTEEEQNKLMEATNSTSIDLAKALQKALNLTIEDLIRKKKNGVDTQA